MTAKSATLDIFYITPIANLPSILQYGVLSHKGAAALDGVVETIYDNEVVLRRQNRVTDDGKSLWDFANFSFNPRNPMMYRVHCCEEQKVVVLKMKKDILRQAKYISIGNAAADASDIVPVSEGIRKLESDDIKKHLYAESWGVGEGKRLIMSELLVPDKVNMLLIDTIYVCNAAMAKEVSGKISAMRLASPPPVIPEPKLFFGDTQSRPLTDNIRLVDGDMFFSKRQTLTISVNTVGVMGKGLAARIKYNIPDIYVKFQELCREGKLTTKKPFLYKERISYDSLMADDPDSLKHKPNDNKYFLLFATKENWRYPSKIEYVKHGFAWLLENAEKEGITSLAMPALGCGLGGLSWAVVGPVMCRNLEQLNIPCEIYLPREKNRIPDAQLSKDFLLADHGDGSLL